jgi:2-polyprenyl-6-methoxyphenol hydroxylase-like FAD-dependent oxidoreductase
MQIEVSATYACLFGLSTTPTPSPPKSLPKGLLGWNLGHNYSYVLGTGPPNQTYWLLSIHLGKIYHGSDIPHFTEEDKERIVREHWDDPITADLRMSDLYENRLHIIVSPLREVVYKRWDCGRMVVLGDAAHKVRTFLLYNSESTEYGG